RTATRVNPIEVEDCAVASLEMKSGALVSLAATLGSQKEISRLRFCFEHVTFERSLEPYRPGDDPWAIIPASPEAEILRGDHDEYCLARHTRGRAAVSGARDRAAVFRRDLPCGRPPDRPRPSEIPELAALIFSAREAPKPVGAPPAAAIA